MYITFNPSALFRGVNSSPAGEAKETVLTKASENKAATQTDKAPVTSALEDFSSIASARDSSGRQVIGKQTVNGNIFDGIKSFFGGSDDNIFRSQDVKEGVNVDTTYTQNDVLNEHINKDGGLLYQKEGDDRFNSALSFAKADIGAIEKSYSQAYEGANKVDSKLNANEITSFSWIDRFQAKDGIEVLDLDADGVISDKEYASYMIVADGLVQSGKKSNFSLDNCDGKVSKQDAAIFDDVIVEDLQGWAKEVYDNYYKN